MTGLWTRVDAFLDRIDPAAVDPLAVVAHGMQVLAARRWRATGRPVPILWQQAERLSVANRLAAVALLTRVRGLLPGPLLVLKGPEVAARYPDPTLRIYADLDLLVEDAKAAQAILLRHGFHELPEVAFAHQMKPLALPGIPLVIELHRRPSWLPWMTPPAPDALFAMGIPSATGVAGVVTLPAPAQAVFLAGHGWRHAPLRRAIDLIDVAAMAGADDDAARATELAEAWGAGPVWAATARATSVVFGDNIASAGLVMTLGTRHLPALRDRTNAEQHAARWLGGLWAPGARGKLSACAGVVAGDLRPLGGEAWSTKLARVARAAASPLDGAGLRQRDSTSLRAGSPAERP